MHVWGSRNCRLTFRRRCSWEPSWQATGVPATERDEPLTGTVALVTGASSGIGEATASALAGLGASVALVARRSERLEALATGLRADGRTALVITADMTDPAQAHSAVEETVATLGRLDIMVNNAGVMLLGPVVGAPVDEWERMISINLLGLLHCTDAALPHLLRAAESSARGVADLVNISSVAGRETRSGSAVYEATKHGVGAFSDALRKEITTRHVRVSLVEPGAVATELASHNRPEVQSRLAERFAKIERLRAEDIASIVTYIVTRPRHMAINEVLVRPTEQE